MADQRAEALDGGRGAEHEQRQRAVEAPAAVAGAAPPVLDRGVEVDHRGDHDQRTARRSPVAAARRSPARWPRRRGSATSRRGRSATRTGRRPGVDRHQTICGAERRHRQVVPVDRLPGQHLRRERDGRGEREGDAADERRAERTQRRGRGRPAPAPSAPRSPAAARRARSASGSGRRTRPARRGRSSGTSERRPIVAVQYQTNAATAAIVGACVIDRLGERVPEDERPADDQRRAGRRNRRREELPRRPDREPACRAARRPGRRCTPPGDTDTTCRRWRPGRPSACCRSARRGGAAPKNGAHTIAGPIVQAEWAWPVTVGGCHR